MTGKVLLGLSGLAIYALLAYVWAVSISREPLPPVDSFWTSMSMFALFAIGTIVIVLAIFIPRPREPRRSFVFTSGSK